MQGFGRDTIKAEHSPFDWVPQSGGSLCRSPKSSLGRSCDDLIQQCQVIMKGFSVESFKTDIGTLLRSPRSFCSIEPASLYIDVSESEVMENEDNLDMVEEEEVLIFGQPGDLMDSVQIQARLPDCPSLSPERELYCTLGIKYSSRALKCYHFMSYELVWIDSCGFNCCFDPVSFAVSAPGGSRVFANGVSPILSSTPILL